MDMRLIFAAAIGFAALAAPATALNTLNIQTGGIYNTAPITGVGNPAISTTGGSFRITGTADTGSFDFDAFCADLARTITVGINTQIAVNYNYAVGPLVVDGFGNPLTLAQQAQVKGLATLGFSLIGDPAKSADIAAIQGAIWQVLHPGATFSSSNGTVDALIGTYVALAPTLKGNARFIFSTDDNATQSLLIPGVPEPATWAMLIVGFGLVGTSLRRRQTVIARTLS